MDIVSIVVKTASPVLASWTSSSIPRVFASSLAKPVSVWNQLSPIDLTMKPILIGPVVGVQSPPVVFDPVDVAVEESVLDPEPQPPTTTANAASAWNTKIFFNLIINPPLESDIHFTRVSPN